MARQKELVESRQMRMRNGRGLTTPFFFLFSSTKAKKTKMAVTRKQQTFFFFFKSKKAHTKGPMHCSFIHCAFHQPHSCLSIHRITFSPLSTLALLLKTKERPATATNTALYYFLPLEASSYPSIHKWVPQRLQLMPLRRHCIRIRSPSQNTSRNSRPWSRRLKTS